MSAHFVLHNLDTGTRGHSLKLFAHYSRIDLITVNIFMYTVYSDVKIC